MKYQIDISHKKSKKTVMDRMNSIASKIAFAQKQDDLESPTIQGHNCITVETRTDEGTLRGVMSSIPSIKSYAIKRI